MEDVVDLPDLSWPQFHVVQQMPMTGFGGSHPILFVEGSGGVTIHRSATRWVEHRQFEHRASALRSDLRVLGRLFDFWQVAWHGQPVHPEDAPLFVWAYLDARLHGAQSPYAISALGWTPAAYSSVQSDLNALTRYLAFVRTAQCSDDPIFGLPRPTLLPATGRIGPPEERDFFSHLRSARLHWAQMFGAIGVRPSYALTEVRNGGSTFSLDRTLSLDDALEIIGAEPNPVYRAIWILACAGGLRISESLHMWQCDVVPPATAAAVGAGYRSTLFVVVPHPSRSRYLGDFNRTRETRERHLELQYGLQPRHHLSGYRRVGWKNPLITDRRLQLSEVFWSNHALADAFDDAYSEVRHFHSVQRTGKRHPYLWVNLNTGNGYGEPVAYRKAYEAFRRACLRVGLEPGISGRRIHGGRHLYKKSLELLKLDERLIQIAMRHKSVHSQRDYGQETADIRKYLQSALSLGDRR